MVNVAKFTADMDVILGEMNGKTFKSIECVKVTSESVYGKCRLNMGTFSIDLYNYIHDMPFFGGVEDIPYFSCKKMDKTSPFEPCERGESPHVYMIDEKITSVKIINDMINVNNGEYEICLDQALIIRTRYNVYSFYKDWMFSELINISVNQTAETIYELEKVKYDWSNRGADPIEVIRTVRVL